MGEVQKLKGKEKFAYGIGAVGKDMVYMLSASYVLYYYQDIMGVSAVARRSYSIGSSNIYGYGVPAY